LGTYDWDMVRDNIEVDERLFALLGLPPGTPVGSIADAMGRVHPDDRARMQRLIASVSTDGEKETREYRILRPDGTARWVASRSKLERDASGKPVRMFGVLQDIHDLKSAEEELRHTSERLQHLSRQLLGAQEAERRQVARELHGEIGQGPTAPLILLQMLVHNPAAAAVSADLHEGCVVLEDTLQQVRRMSLELRPPLLDDLGLVPALKWHIDRVAQRSDLRIHLEMEGFPPRPPAELETVCYRVVQEALTNIVRHARATEVRVAVRQVPGEVRLSITDDGAGFDVAAARARVEAGGSLGLLSMEERAVLVGGQLEVESAPGHGCRISARLPLPAGPALDEMAS